MREWLRTVGQYGKGIAGAVTVVAVGGVLYVAWHLWIDHIAFHQVLAFLNAHAAQINALPPAPPVK